MTDTITTDSGKVYRIEEAWVIVRSNIDQYWDKVIGGADPEKQTHVKDGSKISVKRVWVLVEVEDPIDYSGGNRG